MVWRFGIKSGWMGQVWTDGYVRRSERPKIMKLPHRVFLNAENLHLALNPSARRVPDDDRDPRAGR